MGMRISLEKGDVKPAGAGSPKGVMCVTFVTANDNESFDSLLRRFKKKVQGDRILSEIRKRRYFEQPSIVRKRKRAAKLRKSRRTTIKDRRRQY
jgi:small subunit ribosomal protein S21